MPRVGKPQQPTYEQLVREAIHLLYAKGLTTYQVRSVFNAGWMAFRYRDGLSFSQVETIMAEIYGHMHES